MVTKSDVDLSREFAIEVARLLSDTRCHNVVVLDVTGLSGVTDFMVISTGTSDRQMKTACDEVQELGDNRGFRPLHRVEDNETWACIDLVDIVVHVFSLEARSYYDLENLWGDARKVRWQREAVAG